MFKIFLNFLRSGLEKPIFLAAPRRDRLDFFPAKCCADCRRRKSFPLPEILINRFLAVLEIFILNF